MNGTLRLSRPKVVCSKCWTWYKYGTSFCTLCNRSIASNNESVFEGLKHGDWKAFNHLSVARLLVILNSLVITVVAWIVIANPSKAGFFFSGPLPSQLNQLVAFYRTQPSLMDLALAGGFLLGVVEQVIMTRWAVGRLVLMGALGLEALYSVWISITGMTLPTGLIITTVSAIAAALALAYSAFASED